MGGCGGGVGYLVCLVCIYVYLCISGFPLSAFHGKHIFRIPTFGVSRKTHFQDSHFQRLLKHIFDFVFVYDFWCPEPWEIVGIGGNRVKLSPEPRESWEIVGRSWEIVEIVPNP